MRHWTLRPFTFVVVAVWFVLSPLSTLAQEATPLASPTGDAAAPCTQLFPPAVEGVVVEAVLAETEIPGLGPPAVVATTIIACIEQGAPPTTIEQQAYTTTVVVLSGELTVAYVEPRGANPFAHYTLAADPGTSLALTTTPVTLKNGDMLVYANVLLALTPSTTTETRVLASGITDAVGGAACPCIRWP